MMTNTTGHMSSGAGSLPQQEGFTYPQLGRVEVANVSPQGLLLRVGGREHYLPYRKYPWFQGATARELADVQLLDANHLYWPELDINVILTHHH